MPTIMIGQRPDRNDKQVTVNVSAEGSERRVTLDRQQQYVVAEDVLDVLEHSHEAPYLRVLDRHSKEPTAQDLPPPEKSEQSADLVRTLGKKAKEVSNG